MIDAFVAALDLGVLGFVKAESQATGRPPYDPGDLLKLYVYGYLHRVAPDFKTIANFPVDNHAAVGRVCQSFVHCCRSQALFGGEFVAIDGSKFQADSSPENVTRQTDLMGRLEAVEARLMKALGGAG